jgi:hypothetical protein
MPTFRYRYTGGNPPSPAVLLNLNNPLANARVQDIWGLVDSGADQSVLPEAMIVTLGLVKLDQEVIRGFDGRPQLLGTYKVVFQIRDLAPIELEIIASPHINYPIVGRDVLNRYKVVLDGPNGMLEITGD